MTTLLRVGVGFIFALMLLSLNAYASYDYLYKEDTERVANENRAGRLLELIEFTNLGKSKSDITGRSRKPTVTRQSSDGRYGDEEEADTSRIFDYTWFGPMVDEILLGRYCKREYFKAVVEACNKILGYAAATLGQKKYPTPAQVTANLTAVTKGDFGTDLLTFAPEGVIWYNRTDPLGPPGKQSTILIFVPKSDITLKCNIPSRSGTATIYLKAIKKVKGGSEWKAIVSNADEIFDENVTILVLDFGEFTGNLSCSWTSKPKTITSTRIKN